jgi:hypothetical protein
MPTCHPQAGTASLLDQDVRLWLLECVCGAGRIQIRHYIENGDVPLGYLVVHDARTVADGDRVPARLM